MLKRMKRVAASLGAAALLAGGGVAVAAPAEAAPYGCGAAPGLGYGFTYASAVCAGGSGTFSVWTVCENTAVWPYYKKWAQSGFVRPGQTAIAWCGGLYTTTGQWGIERRN